MKKKFFCSLSQRDDPGLKWSPPMVRTTRLPGILLLRHRTPHGPPAGYVKWTIRIFYSFYLLIVRGWERERGKERVRDTLTNWGLNDRKFRKMATETLMRGRGPVFLNRLPMWSIPILISSHIAAINFHFPKNEEMHRLNCESCHSDTI